MIPSISGSLARCCSHLSLSLSLSVLSTPPDAWGCALLLCKSAPSLPLKSTSIPTSICPSLSQVALHTHTDTNSWMSFIRNGLLFRFNSNLVPLCCWSTFYKLYSVGWVEAFSLNMFSGTAPTVFVVYSSCSGATFLSIPRVFPMIIR